MISLFIYVFYRTEKTLINQVVMSLISRKNYYTLKSAITTAFALPPSVIYSLPEGLWIFSITITSRSFYLEMYGRKWDLTLVPLVIAIVMELFQLLHITNGRFDLMDIVFSVVFWMLALICTRTDEEKESFFQSTGVKTVGCAFCYSIVYLAHVIR